MLAKPIGARCNLACRYCFYLEKEAALYAGGHSVRMSAATLERFVTDYIAAYPGDEVPFAWQGGEPTLMGLEFFAEVVALQRRHGGDRRITNALQTNATLLDDRWAEFLAREKFLVGVSLDGPRLLHDAYRVDRGGDATWAAVMRGVRLLKRHGAAFNTLTVVHRRNVHEAETVYEFLRDAGSGFMQFIPLVERRPAAADVARQFAHAPAGLGRDRLVPAEAAVHEVANECPRPGQFGAFLCAVFDRWVRRDVGRVFVQHFDGALSAWLGAGQTVCTFQERCGRAFALEHNGDVYACDHYVYPEHRLGNLHATPLADLASAHEAQRLGAAKADVAGVCRECPVRFACHGDCPKHRFVATKPGEPGVSYLCGDYRRFFTHIAPMMDRMAALVRAGRPAAEVMRRG